MVSDVSPEHGNGHLLGNCKGEIEIKNDGDERYGFTYPITDIRGDNDGNDSGLKIQVISGTIRYYTAFYENLDFDSKISPAKYRIIDFVTSKGIGEEGEFDCIKPAYDMKDLHKGETCRYVPTARSLWNGGYNNIFVKIKVNEGETATVVIE